MKDKITPEEKLLKLIKGEKREKSFTGNKVLGAPEVSNTVSCPAKALPLGLLKPKPSLNLGKYLTLSLIRNIMWVIGVLSFSYLLISLLYSWFGFKKVKLPDISQEKIELPEYQIKEESRPFESYTQGLSRRQVFGSAGSGSAQVAVAAGDVLKDMNLVGIIAGANPQAVIEDKKNQKTYYVTKGQFIGDYQVEDIQEGKVILNFNGQKYELSI